MPLGWYLAQGLIPLGESSSDDEEGPCTLPNGRVVCGPHGFVTCHKCCSDYSFMDDGNEDEDEDGDEDDKMYWSLSPEARAAIDAKWGPPSRKPQDQAKDDSEDDDEEMRAVVDATWGQNSESEASNDDSLPIPEDPFGLNKRRGTGRVFPARFPASSSARPTELFFGRHTYGNLTRYINRNNLKQVLIFTDGACLNNGLPNPTAGWAFVHGPGFAGNPQVTSGRLESKGPFGEEGIQSSNRAELRAVIAALRFRHWVGEGFKSVVIATDSEYVVAGATQWAKNWIKNGWKTHAKAAVKNKDLWEVLLGEVERWQEKGLSVEFWRIPRDWNEVADAAAKIAATHEEIGEWMDISGICI